MKFPNNLYYLTAELPNRYGYAKKIAQVLNDRQERSSSGQPYTEDIVTNVIRGYYTDDKIRKELTLMVAEHKGKRKQVEEIFKMAEGILND